MNQEKNNNKFLMVVLMALPVLLGGMFVISKNTKNDTPPVNNESLIIPEIDDIEGLDDDKAKIYRDEQTEQMFKTNSDARNIASDKDFFAIDSDFGKEDGKKEQPSIDKETQKVLEQYREPEQKIEERSSQPKTFNQQAEPKTRSANQVKNTENNQKEQSFMMESSYSPQAEKQQSRSSMGVYTADRSLKSLPANIKMDQSKKYLKAVLEEDKTVQNGSNVIFVLSEDGNIDGTNHKRGSILYGRATQGKEFFEINIYQVKSANDGNVYPANLIVYDENYNRGIRSEGFLNEVSKEEGMDAATQTVDDVTRGATSLRALDIATRAITRTASKTARSKPITIPLKKGYKVYLQPKEK